MKNDDIETLRILFGATIGELCNQERWNDAKEMEGIRDRLIQALESQSEDAISRQAALDCFTATKLKKFDFILYARKEIKQLPPVNPQQKTGHWIQENEFFINQDGQFIYKFICSECKSLSYFRKSNRKAIGANVCPNCGAMMQEEEE